MITRMYLDQKLESSQGPGTLNAGRSINFAHIRGGALEKYPGAGTENVGPIVGPGKAIEIASLETEARHLHLDTTRVSFGMSNTHQDVESAAGGLTSIVGRNTRNMRQIAV